MNTRVYILSLISTMAAGCVDPPTDMLGEETTAASSASALTATDIVVAAAVGETDPAATATDVVVGAVVGAAVGESDPAADYIEWRDDELLVPMPVGVDLAPTTYEYVSPDFVLRAPCTANNVAGLQAGIAAGRVATAERENVVVVSPYTNDAVSDRLRVGFADQKQPGCVDALPPATALGPSTTAGIPSTPALAPPPGGLPYAYDVAVGDLDRRINAGGEYRDEVVVAYASPGTSATSLAVTVAVIDYSDASADPLVYPAVTVASPQLQLDMNAIGTSTLPVSTIPLAVTTGDFNDDGKREIGVVYFSSPTQIAVAILAYASTDTGGVLSHSLAVKSAMASTGTIVAPWIIGDVMYGFTPQHWGRGFDAVAGDFDGNGRDELVVAASVSGISREGNNVPAGGIDFKVFRTSADAATTVSLASGELRYVSYSDNYTTPPAQPLEVHLAAGLFKFDAATGNLAIDQLALTWSDTYLYNVRVATLGYSNALALTEFGHTVFSSFWWPSFGIAAGGFTGLRQPTGNANDVLSSIVVPVWSYDGYRFAFYVPDATTGAPVFRTSVSASSVRLDSTASAVVPAVAYDRDGDSQYLGAPVHLTLEELTQTQGIIQEPPKHSYWDKTNKVVSVITRYSSFFAELKTDNSTSFETSTKSTSDFAAGASASVTASQTLGWAGPINKATVSASVSASFGYDYSRHEEGYNSGSATERYVAKIETALDDAVTYTSTTIDIWRYRLYGTSPLDEGGQPIEGYPFIDIALPRGTPKQVMLGGLSVSSWYQPLHENGNILSYPLTLSDGAGGYNQPDMGPVRLPCPSVTHEGCVEDENHMWWLEKFAPLGSFSGAFDGTSSEQMISMTNASGQSQQTQYTHKLSGSVDASTSTSLKVMGVSETTLKSQVEMHSSGSWGELDTSKTTSDATKGVRLVLGAQRPRYGYNYDSVLYITQDGTWKLAFSTDPLGNDTGYLFWHDLYDDGPDPALNLPLRFDPVWNSNNVQYDYVPVTDAVRQKLRGFFVRQTVVDPVSGQHPLLGRAVEAGETVRLEVRVNNYTLAENGAGDGLVVAFRAASTDELGNPISVDLGRTTIPHLPARQVQLATIDWNTADAIYRGAPGSSRTWRIWVELDPDDAITNEIYETEDPDNLPYCSGDVCVDPGQNNEGWADVVVHTMVPSRPPVPATYKLDKGLMAAIEQNGKPKSHNVQARLGQPLEVRVVVTAEVPGTDFRTVRLYDGDPDAGGTLVGEERVHVGDLAGATASFRWLPLQEGKHLLYARLVPLGDDVTPAQDYATLSVNVHRPPPVQRPNRAR